MRIISGQFRGKKLLTVNGKGVRPTADRVKEAMFNLIQFDIRGAAVLDLFCGSGALGIECISRGAASVAFCDADKGSLEITRRNLEGIGVKDAVLIRDDFRGALIAVRQKFDLIFLDPPYNTDFGEIAIGQIFTKRLLKENGKIIFEHSRDKVLKNLLGYGNIDTRYYGDTGISIITYEDLWETRN